ncbi:carbamoyl phosphate synthase small subunit [Marinilactibacillus psychrotolerans]|uniref:Carbamoyl phosphate synthase small chain n=1 Tax=Marinilactibacillus psychrotolerans TaxID=191770 RepID=A0AAV3WNZ2_9LACT|nr:carbamoyl phosphate synthase small subunit [Marinilactibacillus psychrotolerans]GEL66163.1 carbamoyl-phosphate synthase small chain [Marinilactibacillus psychrotolerans]GEQ34672.1 carbamoyl phosphate synthase small subunit [Marinilactibacillus psychrotolerans]SDB95969.1 carbamoyl-phosphate synthase small subunit [Marinilactibacillus psychrotolerans]
MQKRLLILEDGNVFKGYGFGSEKETIGEIVFNTGMTGYQESITDQSYNGQILTFTFPLIGNAGINRDDYESIFPTTKAVIVKEYARVPSNWRSRMNLDEFLKEKNIPGLTGVDTRRLTKVIREHGAMKAMLTNDTYSIEENLERLRKTILRRDHVAQVSTTRPYVSPQNGRKVVVIDFGLKHSILHELNKRDCHVTVLPYNTKVETILNLNPDGVMLTNGPGDPTDLPQVLEMIKDLQRKVPVFGICLGHQLIALANGAKTYKMNFGHRGFNHPVKEIATGKIAFTSQNHGYAVAADSIDTEQLRVTHIEINDHTVEGLRHRHYPVFSVQYHPDAAPGPHDAADLFDQFTELMESWKVGNDYA